MPKDEKQYTFTATQEGHYLSMAELPGRYIKIFESRRMSVGESMTYPAGALVLLVVAPLQPTAEVDINKN